MTDRIRPGLVTFYDIWPGNGAGLFSQPRNLHKANKMIEAVLIPALQHYGRKFAVTKSQSFVETFIVDNKLFKALYWFSKQNQRLFHLSDVQGLFKAGLEFKVGAWILVLRSSCSSVA